MNLTLQPLPTGHQQCASFVLKVLLVPGPTGIVIFFYRDGIRSEIYGGTHHLEAIIAEIWVFV